MAVPLAVIESPEPWSATTCGRLLSRSSTRVTPVCLNSSLDTAVTGLIASRLGLAMREPVTTTSFSSGPASAPVASLAAWTTDGCIAAVAATPPASSATRTARLKIGLLTVVMILFSP